VVIVTNAAKGWVQKSGARFVPRLTRHVEKSGIAVISAQAAFARSCPSGDPADWKKKAFARELERLKKSSGRARAGGAARGVNVISIGDAIFEREAAHFAAKKPGVEATKVTNQLLLQAHPTPCLEDPLLWLLCLCVPACLLSIPCAPLCTRASG
jgi:hypothetical protein